MPPKNYWIIGFKVFAYLLFVCVAVCADIKPEDKQGFFSGRIKANIETKKVGSDWKIALDEF